MKTKKQTYESPGCESILLSANDRFFATSIAEFSSSLEDWKEDEITLD